MSQYLLHIESKSLVNYGQNVEHTVMVKFKN